MARATLSGRLTWRDARVTRRVAKTPRVSKLLLAVRLPRDDRADGQMSSQHLSMYPLSSGAVLHCNHCQGVLMVLIHSSGRYGVRLRGLTWLELPDSVEDRNRSSHDIRRAAPGPGASCLVLFYPSWNALSETGRSVMLVFGPTISPAGLQAMGPRGVGSRAAGHSANREGVLQARIPWVVGRQHHAGSDLYDSLTWRRWVPASRRQRGAIPSPARSPRSTWWQTSGLDGGAQATATASRYL
jgi:hypothetical protein